MIPTLTDGKEKRWSVLVGGTEVIDYLVSFNSAGKVAEEYIMNEYDDIVLYQYDTGEEVRVC